MEMVVKIACSDFTANQIRSFFGGWVVELVEIQKKYLWQ